MKQALDAVIHQGVSVSRAAADYGIPRTTLDDHFKGRVLPGSRSGPRPLLTDREESVLATFLIKSSQIGYPLSRLQVLALVERVLIQKNKEKTRTVTHGWWGSFCRRHPEISLKTSSSLSVARARASSAESLSEYFCTLLQESGLIDQPGLIYNMDESGFPLEPKPPKTIHQKGDKQPYYVTKGTKSQVTVVACVSASGQYIPPMVIWARKKNDTSACDG